ncbi:MAG: hypothetical protein CSA62_11830 [Planctomycetota bacterium]|nr:MAG: hypothetical protein CSA62_11830 [Planctomycetota bacterium]
MPKGKKPSLIGSSFGRPKKVICGRETPCSLCRTGIPKGEDCYDVPQPKRPHSATRRFCAECFAGVLAQTRQDLEKLEAL